MTEEEWTRTALIAPLMSAAFQHTRVRKVDLFACACCRWAYPVPPPEPVRKAFEVMERYRDGLISRSTWRRGNRALLEARTRSELGDETTPVNWEYYAAEAVCRLFTPGGYLGIPRLLLDGVRFHKPERWVRAEVELCDILRDVFGNPFRPVALDPDWRTSTAVALARTMYEGRDFAHMPILADALEDAGCDHPDVIAHCRDPHGVHVRGCWVVDGVLGLA